MMKLNCYTFMDNSWSIYYTVLFFLLSTDEASNAVATADNCWASSYQPLSQRHRLSGMLLKDLRRPVQYDQTGLVPIHTMSPDKHLADKLDFSARKECRNNLPEEVPVIFPLEPRTHGTLILCLFNVGPASKTLAQHWTSKGSRVCWVWWPLKCLASGNSCSSANYRPSAKNY